MSKKQRREQAAASIAATAVKLNEVLTDPQAIRAAMEDTVEVVSETMPALIPGGDDSSCPTSQDDDAQMLAGRDVAGKPSTIDLEDAMAAWGLLPADVLAWRGFTPEAESVLVTGGGVKLFWPSDMDRTLTDTQKGRTVPQPTGEPGGVGRFTRKAD